MYCLACCNDEGKCIGFLGKDNSIITEETKLNQDFLLTFSKKSDANTRTMQINLGHYLLPNGNGCRVTPIKM